ncbi:uncharacterized protein LOC117110613 [Anneissia japonica]|uniref:uncharacterized protein LOC117110613 n=1 Tax=Anneissia japonica TaxID=1529436 RepID=UPI00142553E6|nr:uncharacterized protein LOC117110613 [Anneissia japonica]
MRAVMYLHLILGLLCCAASVHHGETTCSVVPRKGILDGNITIGFIFPFSGPSDDGRGCNATVVPSPDNIQLIEAAIQIVQSINSPATIRGVTIGFEAWDSCHLTSVAVDRSIAYLNEKVSYTGDDGAACSSTSLLAGIIGLSENEPAAAVASVLNEARTPFVSYGASSASLEMYNSFLRTVPSDAMEVQVMVKLLIELKWTYVYTFTSADQFNMAATDHFKMLAKKYGICISDSKTISTNSSASVFNSTISSFTDSTVKVVVLFSSAEDTMKLFQAAKYSSKDFQWVIGQQVLTANIRLQEETNITRGLIGVVPSTLRAQVPAFQPAFTVGSSLDQQADPWFRDYSSVSPQADFNQNVFVAPLQNAFILYSGALRNAHVKKCGGNATGLCEALRSISQEELMSYLTNTTFIGVDGANVSFSSNRQLMNQSYDIVNFGIGSDSNYTLNITVGNFSDNKLTLSTDSIQLWMDGKLVPASNVNSTCNNLCSDPACGDLADTSKVYIPGNIILGGLFGIHEGAPYPSSSGCGNVSADGIQQLEALLYALDRLNKDSSVLPNITIGLDAFDTCNSPSRAGNLVIKLVGGAEFNESGSGQRKDQSGNVEHLYGIIGPGSNDECVEVLKVLGIYDIPDISYSAQSASLSNTYNYPTFARTVSVETMPVAAIIEILVAKGWKYVQAIITPNSYGWNSYSVLSQQAPPKGICVTQQLMPGSGAPMDDLFKGITKGNAANVTILLTEESDTLRFLEELAARNLNGKFYIIASTKWPLDVIPDKIEQVINGLTVVNIRERNVTGFMNYFSKLKPSTNGRNPWFQEYWTNKFNCTLLKDKNNTCRDNLALKTDDVTNPYVGEVVDSVYAMAEALDSLRRSKCPLQESICYEMTAATGTELFTMLRSVNFISINEDRKSVNFNFQGDGSSDYDVFNYQENGGTFKYVKIGSYSKSKLDMDPSMLKYYNASGEVAPNDGNACVGTCDNCETVTKEKVAEVSNGDVWIGGFFELNQPGNDRLKCLNELLLYNMQHLEGFLWAVDQINMNASILPDIKIGAIAFDTCGLPEKARREVTNFVSKAVEYRSGFPRDSIRVIGIIGGETSDTSVEIADVTTPLDISQISYAATSEALNDIAKYPYFMRTVPTDSDQALALVSVIKDFHWSYISVVYSNDGYGIDMLREFSKISQKSRICIAMKVKATNGDFDSSVRKLLTNTQSQVVVLLTSDIDTKQLLDAAERQNVSSIQWLGTETWGSRNFITQTATKTSQHAITLRFQETTAPGFKEYFTKLNPYSNSRNPWFSQYWMDTLKCNLNVWNVQHKYNVTCPWTASIEDTYVEEPEVTYIANAVKAFAIGLNKTMQDLCHATNYVCPEVYNNSELLRNNIRAAKFTGFGGESFSFDAEGNGPPKYDILNFVNGAYNVVGTWRNDKLNWNETDWRTAVDQITSECIGRCTECLSSDNGDVMVANVPGELQIPALFAIHDHADYKEDCGAIRETGIVNLEALLFALDEVNNDTSLLPGVTLGTNAFDTCMTSSRAVRELSSLLGGRLDVDNNGWSSIVGIIGSETDDTTHSLSTVSEQYRYTQISYGASSSVFDDRDEYSYLLRTSPSFSVSIQAIVDLFKYFNWDGASVIYSDTIENRTNLDIFNKAATENDICIQQQLMIPRRASEDNYKNITSAITESDSPSVVVLLTTPLDTSNIQFQANKTTNRHITWIETGTLGSKPPNKTDIKSAVAGSFYVAPTRPEVIESFTEYFNNLSPNNNTRNPWFAEYKNGKSECIAGDEDRCTATGSTLEKLNEETQIRAGLVMDSVYAIAYGIHSLLNKTCGNSGVCAEFLNLEPQDLYSKISTTPFKGISGGQENFTDGYLIRDFDVYNYQNNNNSYSFMNVGTWSHMKALELKSVKLYGADGKQTDTIVSTCNVRPPSTYQPYTSMEYSKSPNSAKTTSEKSVTGDLYYVIVFLCVVGIIVTVATIIFFFIKRKTSLVTRYSFCLCMLLLLGILALYILPMLFGVKASTKICGIQHFVIGFAHAVCATSTLLMSIRLYRTGERERRISGQKTSFTNDSSQLFLFLCFMFVEVLILAEWIVIEPLEELYIKDSDLSSQTWKCFYHMDGLAVSFIYIIILRISTFSVSVWSRMKVDLSYHPQVIGVLIASLGTIVAFIVWVTAAVLTDMDEDIPIYISFGAIVIATINFLGIFPQKILHIYRKYDPRFDDTASILSRSSSIVSDRYVQPRSTSASNVVVENPAAIGEKDDENTDV